MNVVVSKGARFYRHNKTMKMTVWFEKFLPKAESGVQNGVFLQPR